MRTVLEVKKHLKRELHIGGDGDLKDIKPSSIFPSVPCIDPRHITEYLMKTELYSLKTQRWEHVPEAAQLKDELYIPFERVIRDILQHFDNFGHVSVRDTQKASLTSLEEYQIGFVNEQGQEGLAKTSPDLCIMGHGRWFKEKNDDTHSYCFCVAPVELMPENLYKRVAFEEIMLQIAVYARQCFNHQPNRRFVCSIMATEQNFRLLIFDRLGVMWTPEFNIHVEAAAFVRTVLGASSISSKTHSCFDTDIEWLTCEKSEHQYLQITTSGMTAIKVESEKKAAPDAGAPKDRGGAKEETMRTTEEKSARNLKIVVNSKPFVRKAICGRGTRCWYGFIEDPSHTRVVVKESWRSRDRKPESDLLKRVAHLDGVGKMLYFSDSCADAVSKFRNLIFSSAVQDGGFDRYFSRVVLEAYGPPLHYFKSPLQLLCALRDALAGHRFMWDQGILHRDVSVHNIVLGKADAADGNRGVLIDMDMAIDVNDYIRNGGEPRTGTRTFQSHMLLRPCGKGDIRPPQDHLDDLESFFHVLVWIGMLFVAPGKIVARLSETRLLNMEHPDDRICADTKLSILTSPTDTLTPWFHASNPFYDLVRNLGKLLHAQVVKKLDDQLKYKRTPGSKFPKLNVVHGDKENRVKHHDKFLQYFDDSIKTILADDSQAPNAEVQPYDREVRDLDMAAGEAPLQGGLCYFLRR